MNESCIAVCCSVLQCVAVCCSVVPCGAVWFSVVQCVPVCCSVLCVAVCCSVLQCVVRSGTVSWVLSDESDAHHPLSPGIKLGIRKKERWVTNELRMKQECLYTFIYISWVFNPQERRKDESRMSYEWVTNEARDDGLSWVFKPKKERKMRHEWVTNESRMRHVMMD